MTMPASTRPRVVVLLAMVVVALLLLLVMAIDAGATDDSADGATAPRVGVEYTVHSGDTLWAIASVHLAPGDDVRVLIQDIRTANGLEDSVIHPGQVLLIPTAGG